MPDGTTPEASPLFVSLPLSRLRVWQGNPRKVVGDITDLVESVRVLGVLQTLLVRPLAAPDGDVTHEVVAGQRRYLAATVAGLVEVPCTVRDVDDATALTLGLTENAGRVDPHPLEEAHAIDTLVREHGRAPTAIATELGRTLRWVERRLSLLTLLPAWGALLEAGSLPVVHAEKLARIDLGAQQRTFERFGGRAENLPAARAFAVEIARLLHVLPLAKFDVTDASLPGGACGSCRKRSDAQVDLFEAAGTDALCLDGGCWDAKTAAAWERDAAAATARGLKVVDDPAAVFSWGESTRYDGPYARLPEGVTLEPVAFARDHNGVGHELYDRAAVVAAAREVRRPASVGGEEEPEEGAGREPSKWELQRAEQERKDKERIALRAEKARQVVALDLDQLIRLATLSADDTHLDPILDGLGVPVPSGTDLRDAWVRTRATEVLLRAVLASYVMSSPAIGYDGTFDAEEASPLEAEVLGPIFAAPTAPEPTPTKPKRASKKAAPVAAPAPPPAPAVEVPRFHGLADGDRIQLDGIEIELLDADRDGFVWSTTDADPRDRDEGDTEWTAVRRVTDGVWVTNKVADEEPHELTDANLADASRRDAFAAFEEPVAAHEFVELRISTIDLKGIDLYDNGVVALWTSEDRDGDCLKSIVPASLAPAVRQRLGNRLRSESPSDGPSHATGIGQRIATEAGPVEVLGVAVDPIGVPGLVLATAGGPRIAWVDAARVINGAVTVFPSERNVVELDGGELDGGEWRWRSKGAAPATAPIAAPSRLDVTHDPAELCVPGRWVAVTCFAGSWSREVASAGRDEAAKWLSPATADYQGFVQARLYDPDGELTAWWPKGPRPPAIVGIDGQAPPPAFEEPVPADVPIDAEGGELVATVARDRVLIVNDSGDYARSLRGLPGWDPMKTSTAGSHSGGSNRPLVMLFAPADHPDVEKLLARFAKAKRNVLDLGAVERAKVMGCVPSNDAIRERWNVKFPDAKVPIADRRRVFSMPKAVWKQLGTDVRKDLTNPFPGGKTVEWRVQRTAVTTVEPMDPGSPRRDRFDEIRAAHPEMRMIELPADVRQCVDCGCVEALACDKGCEWAGARLCSVCEKLAAKAAKKAAAS